MFTSFPLESATLLLKADPKASWDSFQLDVDQESKTLCFRYDPTTVSAQKLSERIVAVWVIAYTLDSTQWKLSSFAPFAEHAEEIADCLRDSDITSEGDIANFMHDVLELAARWLVHYIDCFDLVKTTNKNLLFGIMSVFENGELSRRRRVCEARFGFKSWLEFEAREGATAEDFWLDDLGYDPSRPWEQVDTNMERMYALTPESCEILSQNLSKWATCGIILEPSHYFNVPTELPSWRLKKPPSRQDILNHLLTFWDHSASFNVSSHYLEIALMVDDRAVGTFSTREFTRDGLILDPNGTNPTEPVSFYGDDFDDFEDDDDDLFEHTSNDAGPYEYTLNAEEGDFVFSMPFHGDPNKFGLN